MKKVAIVLIVLLGVLSVDSASAWFWEKKVVRAPEVSRKVENKPVAERSHGIVATITGLVGDTGSFFRGLYKDFRSSSRQVPGEIRKESAKVGSSLQNTGKDIAKKSKKIPGSLKSGARDIGKDFREIGKDIRKNAKKVLDQ